jgi:hypothetical protein
MRISKLTAKQLNELQNEKYIDIEYKGNEFRIVKRGDILTPFKVYDFSNDGVYSAANLSDIKFYICDLI